MLQHTQLVLQMLLNCCLATKTDGMAFDMAYAVAILDLVFSFSPPPCLHLPPSPGSPSPLVPSLFHLFPLLSSLPSTFPASPSFPSSTAFFSPSGLSSSPLFLPGRLLSPAGVPSGQQPQTHPPLDPHRQRQV